MTAISSLDRTLTILPQGLRIIEIEEPSESSLEYRLLQVTKADKDDATASTIELEDDLSDSESSSFSSLSSSSASRSVHFDLSATMEYENTVMLKDDLAELWYDALDYKDFKRQTYSLAKQMASVELRNRAPHSYQRTVTRTFQLCVEQLEETAASSILSTTEQKHLQHWAQAAPCRLGLDKWALTELQKERSSRKHALKRAVLDLYKTATTNTTTKQQRITTVAPHEQRLPLEEQVRRTSERYSRPGRLFARHMAMSLAAAEANQTTIA